MNQKTILVIDDSTTIRRLADQVLSAAGYAVALAPNAEEGVRLADDVRPDLILLDHQLPGTTGYAVCQQLLGTSHLMHIPIVISSTLRKRAYVEYAELPNVVDLLPKPYAQELLITTVANALDTGALIVESQTQGTAVPEVIDDIGQSDLSGAFSSFSVREVVDFLNNGRKQGTLEIETGHNRYWIFLDEGRVQGVIATGVNPSSIQERLPESLRDLAPVLSVTMGRGGCNEVHGLVELLNSNVLDPRLLRRLLRHQAAVLMFICYTRKARGFRFDAGRNVPSLYQRLPLDISVLALLVEGALRCDASELSEMSDETKFARRPIRGQNLDRGGLTAQHARLLARLTTPRSILELSEDLKWDQQEVRRVLFGLQLADLVDAVLEENLRPVIVIYESDGIAADRLRRELAAAASYELRVVDDRLALHLLVKRGNPDVLVIDLDSEHSKELVREISHTYQVGDCKWIAATSRAADTKLKESTVEYTASLQRPYTIQELVSTLDHVFGRDGDGQRPCDAERPFVEQHVPIDSSDKELACPT